jgi:hypothetical protein
LNNSSIRSLYRLLFSVVTCESFIELERIGDCIAITTVGNIWFPVLKIFSKSIWPKKNDSAVACHVILTASSSSYLERCASEIGHMLRRF